MSISEMLRARPRQGRPATTLEPAIAALLECAETCVMCADACLMEDDPTPLRRCITLNERCADLCFTTARALGRSGADRSELRALLQACEDACRACAEECARHGAHMDHCRICAESCGRCAAACRDLIAALGSAAAA